MKKKLIMLLVTFTFITLTACGNKTETAEPVIEVEKPAAQQEPEEEQKPTEQQKPIAEAETITEQQESEEAESTPFTTSEQSDIVIPEVNITKESIPDNEALQFVQNMKTGWNLGNTLDAHNSNGSFIDELQTETAWGNPVTTKEMIDTVKAAGFNTLRLPITWHQHVTIESTADSHLGAGVTVSTAWVDRVQEIVDYAYANDMYVIINIHHDTDLAYYYPDSAHYGQSANFSYAIWAALSERFKDYDQHLIFEASNEPRLIGTSQEWNFNENDAACQDSADCINRLNQVFVDVVRNSGGNNADRYLMIPSYSASLAAVTSDLFKLPTDTVENRLIVSNHAYTPYNFALKPTDQGGGGSFNPTSPSSTGEIDGLMTKLYDKFISNGIPVVMGEYGAMSRDNNLQDRVNFYAYYVAAAKARGITCCVWDNGYALGSGGETFGLLNRKDLTWVDPKIIETIMKYS